jgi:beta-lactamase class A
MYHYGLLIEKIDKATGTTTLLKQHCKEKAFYTASTIKTVFLGMFLEHCSELLYQEVELSEKDKFIGGICYELKGKTRMTYEMLLWLMICISDNSATNIIFDTLTKKLGDLTTFLQKTFATQKTEVFDLKQQNGASYIKGSGKSTAQEFMKMFHYYVLESPHKDTIKKLLSYQYIK